ncbi:DNA repair protein RAD4 [Ipomoea triloba]|uniref:DNA repair protein RAD4 n=1 Tax=Ipomoea triloba TaxID=35885 RepID=UPI00125D9689|nr:DNA repair protein RAD4 [Ipomoea triloba]XP_031094663.1 DNA repair protein RAD4 [Ipomoea triloba]
MRTRNQSRRLNQSTAEAVVGKHHIDSERQSSSTFEADENETLGNISRDAVRKLLKKAKTRRGFRGSDADDAYLRRCDSTGKHLSESRGKDKQPTGTAFDANSDGMETMQHISTQVKDGGTNSQQPNPEIEDELDWEDGIIPTSNSENNVEQPTTNGVTVEFDVPEDAAKRKTIRRATAEEKDLAELVHRVHLLCLLGRGRLIDFACNDPLIQASLLSLLPTHLLKMSDMPNLTAKALSPLVNWFHKHFHVRGQSATEKSIHSAMRSTLESQEGSPEVVAALSVALFRALNITARFVSILDVASLKPGVDKPDLSDQGHQDPRRKGSDIFNTSTLMVAGSSHPPESPEGHLASSDKGSVCKSPSSDANKTKAGKSLRKKSKSSDSSLADTLKHRVLDQSTSEAQNDSSDTCPMQREQPKRKGDLEFEMQLEMALSATAMESSRENFVPNVVEAHGTSSNHSPYKRMKKIKAEECSASSHGISTAIGSKKIGAPLYWAEVYCSGENLTGKWVHVDAVNALVDGEQNVEAAAAACKIPLRYVIAFAGNGAKDVTRRYCTKWYKIVSKRVNSLWWDAVLEPLKKLEAGAVDDLSHFKHEGSNGKESIKPLNGTCHPKQEQPLESTTLPLKFNSEALEECREKRYSQSSSRASVAASRSDLEDMELETRALTEPLPTNQQAYRTHQLYAIERWLNKYQILYPKGPVLGFCSGHPVYPRTCVQTLHTKERWLRDGLQVKANELPAKVLKRSQKQSKELVGEDDESAEGDPSGTTALYGRWQTEPLCLPPAVNGIVPKNERGQVDVWSEKCLPPGTVHLRLPRIYPVAKRLEIDYAPAMVGFDFRNGRSVPVFEGIVVCAEFKDAILAAYAEEEERRHAEEKRKAEAQALSRWYQLLSSIITRQRLNNCYANGGPSQSTINTPKPDSESSAKPGGSSSENQKMSPERKQESKPVTVPAETDHHEHVFLLDDQTFDEESSTRTKRCRCGFSLQFEEL